MRYYILCPIRDALEDVADFFGILRIKFIGGWYCEYCREIHNRRTYRYKLYFDKDVAKDVCSLGCDALQSGLWIYEGRCLKPREDPDEQQT